MPRAKLDCLWWPHSEDYLPSVVFVWTQQCSPIMAKARTNLEGHSHWPIHTPMSVEE